MKIDASTPHKIGEWIAEQFLQRSRETAIVGLSGGLDSAVVASLCARYAVGITRTTLVFMPSPITSLSSRSRAKAVADQLGTELLVRQLPTVPHYIEGAVRVGNYCARLRMAILYDLANAQCGLVVGTSNLTETLLGYGTLHGDCAWDLNPLGSLYKCEVRDLARLLGVPQEVLDATPSADLWPGQTDEGELGFTYAQADAVLSGHTNGVPPSIVELIRAKQKVTQFKREEPPTWIP